MYQDASANSLLTNPSPEDTASTAPDSRSTSEAGQFLAGTYAERLMDDLFQDVEGLLDMKSSDAVNVLDQEANSFTDETPEPLTAPSPASEAVFQANPVEASTVPDVYPPRVAPLPAVKGYQPETTIAPVGYPDTSLQPITFSSSIQERSRSYDRLLLGVGCVSVVVSLALWLLYQEGKRQRVAVAPSSAQTAPSSADSANGNRQFADYLQKALQNIDQKATPTTATQLPSTSQPPSGTPTVNIPKPNVIPPLTPGRVATGLERIYVPVYQVPPNLYPSGTPIAPLPNLPRNKTTQTLPKPTVTPQTKQAPVASTPAVTRKLVGVLDQGDRSVALIETNGITQRYEIGESVGSSGWTLVDVTKDQAIIRRNGEVRSLFVGHVF